MIRYVLPVLLFASALPAHAQAPAKETPLIERAKLFGNPSKSGGKLSPDGQWLSWIAPRDMRAQCGWRRPVTWRRRGR